MKQWKSLLNNFKQTVARQIDEERGFTLLDVTILLLVVGIIATPIIKEYHIWQKARMQNISNATIGTVEAALQRYYFEHGFYPCPAKPDIRPDTVIDPPESPKFGEENRGFTTPDPFDEACIVPAGTTPNILTGMVPFKTLKLPNEEVLDAWGNKLTYVVTTALTQKPTFNGTGVITVQTPETEQPHPVTGEAVCTPTNLSTSIHPEEVTGVHLLVLSHGEDGSGAFPNNATAPMQCNPNQRDSENCDGDAIFIHNLCINNRTNSTAYFDDYVLQNYAQWTEVPRTLWQGNENSSSMGSVAGNFGVDTTNPQHPIDVVGNIRATVLNAGDAQKSGDTLATEYCNSSGGACFKPDVITGNEPDMQCTTNGVSAIGSNKTHCLTSLPTTEITPGSCPDTQYVIGIDSEGKVICGN